MRERRRMAVLVGLTLAVTAGTVFGQRGSQMQQMQQMPQAPPSPAAAPPQRYEVATANEAKISRTSHTLSLGGREIKYTATTGTVLIRLDNGQPGARMFFVAYTKDGEEKKTRPLSFLFNGGPGSASIWLHMGSFAPVRVEMAAEGLQPAPPYKLAENENSLIETTDMVFVDAISTGYSRVMPGVDSSQYHGQDGDIRAFGEFISEYLTTWDRWASPKFLIGESYGTIRSAGLAQELQSRHGIELNGIVLLSALLTYQTLSPAPNNDIAWAVLVPTYAATAWYHKRLPADLQKKTIRQIHEESRAFAFGDYMAALVRGNTLSDAERGAMAEKLARFTGLSAKYILASNLRVDAARYRKELLRDQRLTVGRLDSRFTALDADAAGERQEFDPSNTALSGPYVAIFRDYVKNTLKWESDLRYPTSGGVQPWTYVQNRYMDMTEALRSSMAKNPFLKVFVICGYYDMATIPAGIEYNISHLAYDRQITSRVSFGYYEGGHMMYIRPSAHAKLTKETADFIRAAKQ